MPQTNFITWMTILGACRLFSDEKRAKRIFKKIPDHVSSYVVLSNIFAKMNNFEEHSNILNDIKQKKNEKNTRTILDSH